MISRRHEFLSRAKLRKDFIITIFIVPTSLISALIISSAACAEAEYYSLQKIVDALAITLSKRELPALLYG